MYPEITYKSIWLNHKCKIMRVFIYSVISEDHMPIRVKPDQTDRYRFLSKYIEAYLIFLIVIGAWMEHDHLYSESSLRVSR